MPWREIIAILSKIEPKHIIAIAWVVCLILDRVPQVNQDPTFQQIKALIEKLKDSENERGNEVAIK